MRTSKKKRTLFILFCFLLIFVVAAILANPDEKAHKDAFRTKVVSIADEIIAEKSDKFGTSLWNLAGGQLISVFIDNNVSINNYFLFSLTKIVWNEESHLVGIGAFGRVYITKRLNRELADTIINQIGNSVYDSLPDFLKNLSFD